MKKKLLLGLLITNTVLASNMSAPVIFPSAMVLPKGVRNLNYKAAVTSVDSIFNNSGSKATLADPMFLDITFGDIILGKKNDFDKAAVKAKMLAVGADENTVIAKSTGAINAEVTVQVPILAWGITEKWTAAVAVPIKTQSISIDTGVIQTNDKIIKALRNKLALDGQGKEIEELDRKLADPVKSKAEELGYEAILRNEKKTMLGDIKLVNKYKVLENESNILTLSGEITLPTGETSILDRVVNVPGGDGQTDLGASVTHDFKFAKYFTFTSNFAYTVQLADTVERRIPEQYKSAASGDIDTNTSRNLGDILSLTFAPSVNYRGASLAVGYSFNYKQADTYSGSLYESQRYGWLAKNSQQTMNAFMGKVGYDTITLYREGKFPLPALISLTHTQIMSGKNVVNNPLTTLDISMFF
jgi:hypothetical protein